MCRVISACSLLGIILRALGWGRRRGVSRRGLLLGNRQLPTGILACRYQVNARLNPNACNIDRQALGSAPRHTYLINEDIRKVGGQEARVGHSER